MWQFQLFVVGENDPTGQCHRHWVSWLKFSSKINSLCLLVVKSHYLFGGIQAALQTGNQADLVKDFHDCHLAGFW